MKINITKPIRISNNGRPRFVGHIIPGLILTLASLTLSGTVQAACEQGCSADNTFLGQDALVSLTTGIENTAVGSGALTNTTEGLFNTATGDDSLSANTTGFNNTANGWHALIGNTTGGTNTGIGCDALKNNVSGNNNIALGFRCGERVNGDNNITIGNLGAAGESGTIRIGTRTTHKATYISGIFGATLPSGAAVAVDNLGHLGTVTSSARFKEQIKPIGKASEELFDLKPVSFRYKSDLDPQHTQQFGLVAEEVAKVNPDLVARDNEGKPYSVRYEAVNAMLLNEFLKEHQKGQDQDRKIEELERTVAKLESTCREQAALIQTVSTQLNLSNATARVAAGN